MEWKPEDIPPEWKNTPLDDEEFTKEKGVFFHLERLIGKNLFELATSKESVVEALSTASIPDVIWKEAKHIGMTDGEPNTSYALDLLASHIYEEVLVHKILDLPYTPNWKKLAFEKNVSEDREEIIRKFWIGVKKHNIPVQDALKALAHVGISGPDIKQIFEAD